MHVVPNNFPIVQEGILGSDFLCDNATIDFPRKLLLWQGIEIPFAQHDSIVVPARSRTTFYINIKNPEVKTGYIPRLEIHKDIYVGEALVENRDGKAYLQIINAGEIDREVVVPTVQMQEVELIESKSCHNSSPLPFIPNASSVNLVSQTNAQERITRIRELLRLDHLNKEEQHQVLKAY
ncbi:hypothetical protein P5V15_012804 [Pogonomyrmex californicus]